MEKNNYFLIGAFEVNDKIIKIEPCYSRENLVYCPDIISYYVVESSVLKDKKIKYYINSFGTCFFICDYSKIDNLTDNADIERDYNFENKIYDILYLAIIKNINEKFKLSIEDVDWVMLAKQGALNITNDFIILDFEDKVQLYALIDCSLISEFITNAGKFFKNISLKESLTRFEQYQILTYTHTIASISFPSYFLTNSKEIDIYNKYYDAWNLHENIEIINKVADKSIAMFKFLSGYKDENRKSLINLLVSYISISLSYDPVIEFFVKFLHLDEVKVKYYTDILFITITSIIVIMIVIKVYKITKENIAFKNKTVK